MNGKHKKFAGTGMHEFYMPTTKRGRLDRRDRRKCRYYNKLSKWCTELKADCIGPSLCTKYLEIQQKKRPSDNKSLIGKKVYNKHRGIGLIISVSGDIFTVQYKDIKLQCRKEHLQFFN